LARTDDEFAEEGLSFMYLQLAAEMWSSGENICIFMREEKREKKNGWLDFQHPEMDLVLGLPWLCKTRTVPDYDDLSYTFIDSKNKVVNVRPYNSSRPRSRLLSTIIGNRKFDNKFVQLAYETSPESFREVVGLPKYKSFEHNIDTGTAGAVKVHGQPYSPPEHLLIKDFVKDGLKDGIIRPSKSPWLAPIILVKKPDGSSRACVDIRN
jgi:hypothetical protein